MHYETGERDNAIIDGEKSGECILLLLEVVYRYGYLTLREALDAGLPLVARFIQQFRGDNSSAMQKSIGSARSGVARRIIVQNCTAAAPRRFCSNKIYQRVIYSLARGGTRGAHKRNSYTFTLRCRCVCSRARKMQQGFYFPCYTRPPVSHFLAACYVSDL